MLARLAKAILRAAALPLLLCCSLVVAQQQDIQKSPANVPDTALKVTTRLVQLSVVVHDHQGHPVTNLSKDDFEVTDQGKRQSIRLFSVDSLIQPSGTTAAAATAFFPRNVTTNRPPRQSGVPTSVTVLLLDFYDTKLTDQMSNRRHIAGFLRQLRPEDRVAIYLLKPSGFSVVHDFTNNSSSLMASLAKAMPGFSHELDGSDVEPANTGDSDADAILDTSSTRMANFFTRNRVINTCIAFKVLARHLGGVPGRKNVVWLSGGFPIQLGFGDPQDQMDKSVASKGATSADQEIFSDYLQTASQEMNTANAAVYPVDARGLMGLPMVDASRRVTINPKTMQLPQSEMRVDTSNIDTMNYIADLTGGKAYYNTNGIQTAIRSAIDDSSVTYTLGYYLDEDRWDNKFHKIKVHVHRGGMSVRSKKGYLASEPAVPSPAKIEMALKEAIWSPLDSTRIGITVRVDPSTASPSSTRLQFSMDTSEIAFQQENGRYDASFFVAFVQQTKKGKMLADTKRTVSIRATPEQFSDLQTRGLSAGEDIKVNADTEALRVVIMDRRTGLAGSATIPIEAMDKSSASLPPAPAGKL